MVCVFRVIHKIHLQIHRMSLEEDQRVTEGLEVKDDEIHVLYPLGLLKAFGHVLGCFKQIL